MRVPIYQVDAFALRKFGGNPAAVMPLQAFLDDAVLQAIALENNLSETAFLVRFGRDWRLRWFTPATEVPLCGHATLASAWVVTERLDPGCARVVFHTLSGRALCARALLDRASRKTGDPRLPGVGARRRDDLPRPRRAR